MKVYTSDELAAADGKDGSAAHVAVQGKVYDVSKSKRWVNGSHMRMHCAGADLTREIKSAPHGLEVLERCELVGTLQDDRREGASGLKGTLEAWLDRHPFFRRHPHPAIVHLPVGIFAVAPFMEIIALLWSSPCTEWAAYCCTLAGFLAIPASIATGYFTWWINYDAGYLPILVTKRRMAWLALFLGALAVAVRSFLVDQPLSIQDTRTFVYVVVLVLAAGTVAGVGFLGGKLIFPYD
jgi:predicted heme/steroid binding protein/uncharacterized membrane protein